MTTAAQVDPLPGKASFNCPHCHALAAQETFSLLRMHGGRQHGTGFQGTQCFACKQLAAWREGQLLWPAALTAPLPHADLPADCQKDFEEAREVRPMSPRAAAALLRLVVEKLMTHFGQPGKKLDDAIAALVKGGLSPIIQQSLDSCRVIGNNAVHPGQMDLEDKPETADAMFRLVNMIVEKMITEPRHAREVYDSLPPRALAAIEKRDGKGTGEE